MASAVPFRRLLQPDAQPHAVDDRTIRGIISDESVALDGHIVRTPGARYTVPLPAPWSHDTDSLPLGKWNRIYARGTQLIGELEFVDPEIYDLAGVILRLMRGGFVRGFSIGFQPLRWKPRQGARSGMDIEEWMLLECSPVLVPSNQNAIALDAARSAGIDTQPLAAWAASRIDRGSFGVMTRSSLESIHKAASPSKAYAAPAHRGPTFRSIGEQLQAIAHAAMTREQDSRLARAPSGLGETDPTAGGFLIEDVWIDDLLGSIYEESVIAQLCDRRMTDNPISDHKLPRIDETSRANGARWGGVMAFWAAEAQNVPASFPKFGAIEFAPSRLICAVQTSNELLADAPMLDGHLRRAVTSEFSFMLDGAILAGSGAGSPLGVMNSGALVTVAKQTGQASGTILAENVDAMWKALPAPCRRRAIWLANEDADAALATMVQPIGTAGTAAASIAGMYLPAGAAGNESPLLKGRPVHVIEQASPIGTPGDLVLIDPTQYIILDSGTNVRLSVHVAFASDQSVFRFRWRVDGRPAWANPITPYNGTAARSPYVALAAR